MKGDHETPLKASYRLLFSPKKKPPNKNNPKNTVGGGGRVKDVNILLLGVTRMDKMRNEFRWSGLEAK